ncbi:hypothetical protein D9M71_675980 [compost metagenome]
MHIDDRRHQDLLHFDDCWLRLDRWWHQGLQQRRDGRDRRHNRDRSFDHRRLEHWRHRCLHRDDRHSGCGVAGLLFEHRCLKLVQHRFCGDLLGHCLYGQRQFFGHFLQQAVQVGLQCQLRARSSLQWPVHGSPLVGASLLAMEV